jgi:hypothetical protein
MWLFGMIVRDPADLASQVTKRHRDGLVAVPCGVLADERGPGAGVAEPGHQLLKAQQVHAGYTGFRAGLDSDPPEVGAPEPRVLGTDED